MEVSNTPNSLDGLSLVSSHMGLDSRLIQATGGNTSLKENGILWIKASGKSLATALEENIFTSIDLADAIEQLKDLNSTGELSFQSLSQVNLRPSIETSLHALMPHRVVLHSHPIDIISLGLMPESKIYIKQALRDLKWQWIPYSRPGKPLTASIATALARKPTDVLILANHGLVVGGSSPEKAFKLQKEVTNRLIQTPRPEPEVNEFELSQWSSKIPGSRLPRNSTIHSIATDPFSYELAMRNPPYPDHVVFCGIQPWIITSKDLVPKPNTTYGMIPGVGVILLEAANSAVEAMLQAQAEVYLRIPPGSDVTLLSNAQSIELLSWDEEKYRQAISNK